MEEDENMLIILGRPFLSMGRAKIHVEMGELKLQVQNDLVIFNVFKDLDPYYNSTSSSYIFEVRSPSSPPSSEPYASYYYFRPPEDDKKSHAKYYKSSAMEGKRAQSGKKSRFGS